MITGLICGGVKGFYDGQGVQVNPESLDNMLTFGPMALDGMLFGGFGVMNIYVQSGGKAPLYAYAIDGPAAMSFGGALLGGLCTLIGYVPGRILGGVLK